MLKEKPWILLLLSVLFTLAGAELGLRFMGDSGNRLCVFPPNLHYKFYPDPSVLFGCKGEKNFTTNSYGARPVNSGSKVTVLFIGGSTTECLYLDDKETWPAKYLQSYGSSGMSIGKSGQTTREHVWQLQHFLPQAKTIKEVIVLCGLNDMLKVLSDTTQLKNEVPQNDKAYLQSFTSTNSFSTARLRLGGLVYNVFRNFFPDTTGQYQQDAKGLIVRSWRQHRVQRSMLISDTTFALAHRNQGLEVFRSNLRTMIRLAKEQKQNIRFITPIAAWNDTSEAVQKKCWMGGLGDFQRQQGLPYYSFSFLSYELERYNHVLLEECKNAGVACIDVRSAFTVPSALFYDDCHFHEQGALKFSEAIRRTQN